MKALSRNSTAMVIVLLVALAVAGASFNAAHSAESRLDTLRAEHSEMISMKDELSALKNHVASVEGRGGLGRVAGIEQAVDYVLTPMGLKGKMKSLKKVGSGADGDSAELSLRDMDMNETVNVLYAFENVQIPVVIRQAELRASFQRPSRLDVTVTLSLVKK